MDSVKKGLKRRKSYKSQQKPRKNKEKKVYAYFFYPCYDVDRGDNDESVKDSNCQ